MAAALRGRNVGRRLPPGVRPGAVEAVFTKGQYSAAYSGFEGIDETGTTLADWLRQRGVDEVDIVGIATDYCVRATATDAAARRLRHPRAAETDRRRGAGVDRQGRRGHARRRRRGRLRLGGLTLGLPVHFGGLPLVNARTPSLASSWPMSARWISVSRAPTAARSRSNESHSSRLLAATASGAVFCAMSRASSWRGGQHLVGVEHPAAQPQLHRPTAVERRRRSAGSRRRWRSRPAAGGPSASRRRRRCRGAPARRRTARRRRRTGCRTAGPASDPARWRGRSPRRSPAWTASRRARRYPPREKPGPGSAKVCSPAAEVGARAEAGGAPVSTIDPDGVVAVAGHGRRRPAPHASRRRRRCAVRPVQRDGCHTPSTSSAGAVDGRSGGSSKRSTSG